MFFFFAATLQNNFKQFALKMQYPPPPPFFKSNLHSVVLWDILHLTHSVVYTLSATVYTVKKHRELHSRYRLLNNSNRRAFSMSLLFLLSQRSELSIMFSLRCKYAFICFVSSGHRMFVSRHHLSEIGWVWSVGRRAGRSHRGHISCSICVLCSFKLLEGAVMSFLLQFL